MIKICDLLERLIRAMTTLIDETIDFNINGIEAQLLIKKNSTFSLKLNSKIKSKDETITLESIPFYSYHNAVANLVPYLKQLKCMENSCSNENKQATIDTYIGFASMLRHVEQLFGEDTLVRSECFITELLPQNLKNNVIIVCSPINNYMVLTIHYIKLIQKSVNQTPQISSLWRTLPVNHVISYNGNDYKVTMSMSQLQEFAHQEGIMKLIKIIQEQTMSTITLLESLE